MAYKKELKQLTRLPYFDMGTLGNLLGIEGETRRTYIKRALKREDLMRLKRGWYVTKQYWERESDKIAYGEFLANKLCEPSYLSLAYVLQKYAMISESVFAYTSITTNRKTEYLSQVGSFLYTNLKLELFDGYEVLQKRDYQIRQATKAEALFDYLYMTTKSWRNVHKESILGLRLNVEEMEKNDWDEFDKYVIGWGGRKMKKIRRLICSLL